MGQVFINDHNIVIYFYDYIYKFCKTVIETKLFKYFEKTQY